MNTRKEMTGKRCGRLVVICEVGRDTSGNILWKCQCDCGKEAVVSGDKLRSGNTSSCGCYLREYREKGRRTHGKTHSRVYGIWQNMIQRCRNPKATKWAIYGGRGISVCERWRTFENFYEDMGDPPVGTSLDRIDSDGDYQKSNCRWATTDIQTRNKRDSRIIEFNGRKQNLVDWGIELEIDPNTLYTRLIRGWTIERAFTTPVKG